jgi:hypothetical protein
LVPSDRQVDTDVEAREDEHRTAQNLGFAKRNREPEVRASKLEEINFGRKNGEIGKRREERVAIGHHTSTGDQRHQWLVHVQKRIKLEKSGEFTILPSKF